MIEVIKDLLKAFFDNAIGIGIILGIVLIIYFLLMLKNAVKLTRDTIVVFTGTLGSGKTFSAVKLAVKTYKRYMWSYRLNKIIRPWKKIPKPKIYSNIPIKYKRKQWSTKIESSQLIFQRQFTGRPIVVIDEIGSIAGQNDYDNDYVVNLLANRFVRFFRHTCNGRLIMTDQAVSSIYKGVRVRMGITYSLSNFRKKYLFFYKTNCRTMEITDDSVSNVNIMNNAEVPYLFGFIGKTFKQYDSRCYSILYDDLPILEKEYQWTKFKTKEFIELPFKKLRVRYSSSSTSVSPTYE